VTPLTPAIVANIDRMLRSGFANAPTPPCQPHVMAAAHQLVGIFGQGYFMAGWRDPKADSIANGFHPRGLAVDWYVPRSPTGGLDGSTGAKVASWAWQRPDVLEVIYDGHLATVAHEASGWRIYTPPPGESNHAEHVHISFAPAGESHSTIGRRPFPWVDWPNPITPTDPPQQEEEDMILFSQIAPFEGVYVIGPATHCTAEMIEVASGIKPMPDDHIVRSKFHALAIGSHLFATGATGSSLVLLPGQTLTPDQRNALTAAGVTGVAA
jgi:hypothetical protein